MFAAGTRRAVEEHLAELVRDAVDHPQRPLLDARLVHGDRERRQSLVLRHVGIGAREQQAPVGDVGANAAVTRSAMLVLPLPAAPYRNKPRPELMAGPSRSSILLSSSKS